MNLLDLLEDTPETDAETAAPTQPPLLTVSQLTSTLKSTVEALFAEVRLEGEVSRVTRAASGHYYFDIKDDKALINAIIWKGTAQGLATLPKEGQQVIATGRLTTYPARSNYQIIINDLQPAGEGALLAQLAALKAKLAAEGLFDEARKQRLPFLPRKIGLITSPTGAVIDDMLHRITARCPRPVMLAGVSVQGVNAPQEIIAALNTFNALPKPDQPDVLIIARGGGSLEDLMAFNDEAVVRAIAASTIPTISAVGHEPDVTLADFAADVRAPTPTAAAELVVPVKADLLATLSAYQKRLPQGLRQHVIRQREKVRYIQKALPHPQNHINEQRQRLDLALSSLMRAARDKTTHLRYKTRQNATKLDAYAPQRNAARGLIYATDAAGNIIKSANTEAKKATLHFADGTREATLT